MQEQNVQRRERNRLLERSVFLFIIALLVGWAAYDHVISAPCSVVVDAKPVVTLESVRAARSVLDVTLARKLSGKTVTSPSFEQHVVLKRASRDAGVSLTQDAAAILDRILTLKAHAYAILVDGEPIAALQNRDEAQRALDLLLKKHSQNMRNLYAQPKFMEVVALDRRYLDVDRILATSEEAADHLSKPHGRPVYHTVEPGDRAYKLIARYRTSLAELERLNPALDIERLTVGDRLLVSMPKPPLTVVTKALVTTVTPIKSPPMRGIPSKIGRRQTWMVVTYENGIEARRDVTRVMTAWDKPSSKSRYQTQGWYMRDQSPYTPGQATGPIQGLLVLAGDRHDRSPECPTYHSGRQRPGCQQDPELVGGQIGMRFSHKRDEDQSPNQRDYREQAVHSGE